MMNELAWVQAIEPVGELVRRPLALNSDTEAWHARLHFEEWAQPEGSPPLTRQETYGWKKQLIGEGAERVVGEIVLAQRLRKAGFRAYWLDTFGSAPEPWRKWIAKAEELPPWLSSFERRVRQSVGRKAGGAPDVVAWRPNREEPYFIEYKGPKDKIREGQDAWYRAALKHGLPETSFVVAVWAE